MQSTIKSLTNLAALAVLVSPAASAAPQATPYGAGCAGLQVGSAGAPLAGSASFQVTLTGGAPSAPAVLIIGASDAVWSGFPLPLDLTATGAPGCQLLASLDLTQGLATDAGGAAAQPLPLPCSPNLVGKTLFLQFAVLTPSKKRLRRTRGSTLPRTPG